MKISELIDSFSRRFPYDCGAHSRICCSMTMQRAATESSADSASAVGSRPISNPPMDQFPPCSDGSRAGKLAPVAICVSRSAEYTTRASCLPKLIVRSRALLLIREDKLAPAKGLPTRGRSPGAGARGRPDAALGHPRLRPSGRVRCGTSTGSLANLEAALQASPFALRCYRRKGRVLPRAPRARGAEMAWFPIP